MQLNSAVEFAPTINDNKKIEVSVENNEAIIKLSTLVEGLGWSCQKTMRIESEMLDDLHHAISAARYRLNANKAQQQTFSATNVIEFPSVA